MQAIDEEDNVSNTAAAYQELSLLYQNFIDTASMYGKVRLMHYDVIISHDADAYGQLTVMAMVLMMMLWW